MLVCTRQKKLLKIVAGKYYHQRRQLFAKLHFTAIYNSKMNVLVFQTRQLKLHHIIKRKTLVNR